MFICRWVDVANNTPYTQNCRNIARNTTYRKSGSEIHTLPIPTASMPWPRNPLAGLLNVTCIGSLAASLLPPLPGLLVVVIVVVMALMHQ